MALLNFSGNKNFGHVLCVLFRCKMSGLKIQGPLYTQCGVNHVNYRHNTSTAPRLCVPCITLSLVVALSHAFPILHGLFHINPYLPDALLTFTISWSVRPGLHQNEDSRPLLDRSASRRACPEAPYP